MNAITTVLIVLLLCIQLICGNAARSTSNQNTGTESKLRQITDLALSSKGNVINLDDESFNYYAISKPRTYSLVVFMTAAHPKFKCSICKTIDKEMTLVAQAYMKDVSSRGEVPNVFFVRLDYESAQKTFMNYEVNSVPILFYIGPLAATNANELKPFTIPARDRYQISADPSAESIASFLRDRTNISIEIKRSMVWMYVAILAVFAVMALLVKPVIDSLPFWLRIIRNKSMWAIVSSGVYTCAISGLIFDIIRSPQMYYANPQTGQIMFFYPQSGNQFVVEGFVIGFLNLSCAAALIFVAAIAPHFKDEQWRTISMAGGIFVFVLCFRFIRRLYIMKNQWYGARY